MMMSVRKVVKQKYISGQTKKPCQIVLRMKKIAKENVEKMGKW